MGGANPNVEIAVVSSVDGEQTALSVQGAGDGGNGGSAGTTGNLGACGGGMFSGGPRGSKTGNADGYGGTSCQNNGGRGASGGWASGGYGGGAGNPPGSKGSSGWLSGDAQAAQDGVGGTVLLIVEGTLSGTGSITAKGGKCGDINCHGGQCNPSSGGGGSGGGVVHVYAAAGGAGISIDVSGGAGGIAYNGPYTATNGNAGSSGSINKVTALGANWNN